MGLFKKAGFNVTAYPVAFRTPGPGRGLQWETDPARNLQTFEIALHEWIGLAAYRATGRIDRLFPAPGEGLEGETSESATSASAASAGSQSR
jgi:hypothetical protein